MNIRIKTLDDAEQAFADVTNLWREGSIGDDSAREAIEAISQRVRDIVVKAQQDGDESKRAMLETMSACIDVLRAQVH